MSVSEIDPPTDDGASFASKARWLLKDALVWDAHAGFGTSVTQDLDQLRRWEEVDVNFLSVNVGFDVHPWELTIQVLAAYRHWIAARPDRFILVERIGDVLRARRENKLAVAFDLEGAVSLSGQLSMLALYHRLGVRQIHFAYNLNNDAAGGCQDEDEGLTKFGRQLVVEANRLGMLLDLSHVGHRSSLEVVERSGEPVVYSHANSKAMADHPRNITDEQMRAVAAKGGVVAVTGVGRFLGDPDASSASFVRAIDLAVQRIGVRSVAIGLDYNFAPGGPTRFPAFWPEKWYTGKFAYLGPHQLPEITELLLKRGYSELDVRAIYGENYFRIAAQVWSAADKIDT